MLLPLQKAEMDRSRDVDMAEVDDPRVDLCLFCLPPHRLRPVDVRYMAELGKVVPILPIVTKADTMSTAEAAKYRREVYNRLQSPGVPCSKGEGTGRRCGKARGVPGLPDASPAAPPMEECNMAELAKALKNPWRARSDKSGLFCVSCIHLATDLVGAQQQRVALPRLCLRRAELQMAEESRGPQQNMWMATIGTNDCCLSASEDTNHVRAASNTVFVQQPWAAACCCWLTRAWLTCALLAVPQRLGPAPLIAVQPAAPLLCMRQSERALRACCPCLLSHP